MHRCSIQSSRLLPGFFAVLSHSHERGTQVDRNKVYSHNLITVLLSTLQLSRFFSRVSRVRCSCRSIAQPWRFVKPFISSGPTIAFSMFEHFVCFVRSFIVAVVSHIRCALSSTFAVSFFASGKFVCPGALHLLFLSERTWQQDKTVLRQEHVGTRKKRKGNRDPCHQTGASQCFTSKPTGAPEAR
jgi:hypothetical protein